MRLREARDAGVARRHRRLAVRRRDQHHAGRSAPGSAWRDAVGIGARRECGRDPRARGSCTPTRSGTRSSAASIRAGICIRRSSPTRYAAVFAFFLEGLNAASDRLKNFVQKAAQATLVGDVFDDAATGQGLLNYFLRAMNCGAITEQEAVDMSGLSRRGAAQPIVREDSGRATRRPESGLQDIRGTLRSAIRRFDQPVRLLRRDEDLVRVVEAERREIDEQVVAVRQRELDLDDAAARRKRRLPIA